MSDSTVRVTNSNRMASEIGCFDTPNERAIAEVFHSRGIWMCGKHLIDVVNRWDLARFTPDEVASWIDIGCRNPLVASAWRDSGITPQAILHRSAEAREIRDRELRSEIDGIEREISRLQSKLDYSLSELAFDLVDEIVGGVNGGASHA